MSTQWLLFLLVLPQLGIIQASHITQQDPRKRASQRVVTKAPKPHPLTWNKYHRAKDIEAYLDYLAKLEPSLVSILTIGKSFEGRPLRVVKIASDSSSINPGIWIDAGMHGGEWIAPAVALYVLKQLVENYTNNRDIVDTVDWYIMPLANPDGYEYSHSTERLWRKSRSKKGIGVLGRILWGNIDDNEWCTGVDLNRNFDFHWGEADSWDNPCRLNYAGSKPFSEPETRAIADFILQQSGLKAYISLHSYSQMWLLPWTYTKETAIDHDELMSLGRQAVDALQNVYGTVYELGSSPQLLYPASGSSQDWAKGRAGIKYSYTVELRDNGTYGFLLPASQIIPTGKETYAAIETIAKHIAQPVSD